MTLLRSLLSIVAVSALVIESGQAQSFAASQKGVVTQVVAHTTITVHYRRPVARGRALVPGVVKFGEIWTPGADSATTVEFSRDVLVNGHRLPKGKYGLWAIPNATEWTFIFNGEPDVFHRVYPEGQDVLRVHATPGHRSHVEVMTFGFPYVERDSAVLEFHWGETAVPISIKAILDSPSSSRQPDPMARPKDFLHERGSR